MTIRLKFVKLWGIERKSTFYDPYAGDGADIWGRKITTTTIAPLPGIGLVFRHEERGQFLEK